MTSFGCLATAENRVLKLMQINVSNAHHCCLSLADGYMGECQIVEHHNADIGATCDDLIEVPEELSGEFQKLATKIQKVGRAFELGLIY